MAVTLSKALAEDKGIAMAKPDSEKQNLEIIFDPSKTNADNLKKAVLALAPKAELEKVGLADANAMKHDCGKCPSKSSCTKAKI